MVPLYHSKGGRATAPGRAWGNAERNAKSAGESFPRSVLLLNRAVLVPRFAGERPSSDGPDWMGALPHDAGAFGVAPYLDGRAALDRLFPARCRQLGSSICPVLYLRPPAAAFAVFCRLWFRVLFLRSGPFLRRRPPLRLRAFRPALRSGGQGRARARSAPSGRSRPASRW